MRRLGTALIFCGLSLSGVAEAGWPEQLEQCLRLNDGPCAQAILDDLEVERMSDPGSLALVAEAEFYAGRYPQAFDTLSRAVEAGHSDRWLSLYERTLYATADWVEAERDSFRVRYRPGVDVVLLDGAFEALQQSEDFITPLLGGPVPGDTILEIFPDGRSFIAASSLTKDDVEATGVVALSKWSRLLLTSPRALGRGYDWQDTVAHEYIHLVVAHYTADAAPVWLQEAIAKYLDNRWVDGSNGYQLSVRSQGFLAAALKDDDLVPFDEMHPSLAKIKVYQEDGSVDNQASAERSALAYAQLSSMMAFCFEIAGDEVLLRTLPRVRDGEDPRIALAEASGFTDFSALQEGWLTWVRGLELMQRRLESLPTVIDGGDELDVDPVLSRRRDLARYLRLGDLLYDRGRYQGSLVEYSKAHDENDAHSPLLVNRVARAHVGLNDYNIARKLLEASTVDYPGFALSWKTLGDVHRTQERRSSAVEAFEVAVSLNPFDVESRRALVGLHRELGDMVSAGREEQLVQVLRQGGEDDTAEPIHQRHGEYELPRSKEVLDAEKAMRGELEGDLAPALDIETLAGEQLTLDDLQGKVVLLDFWATWCGPCRRIMPELSRMQEDYGDSGLQVVGITDEGKTVVEQFLRKEEQRGNALGYVFARDRGPTKGRYGIQALPTLFVLDRDGIVQKVHVGGGDLAPIEELIVGLLEGGGTTP
jgi:thiol-disulfide isomerase/thioredoxin